MKSLDKLSNIEKAKLLFDMFPLQMPAFIVFAGALTRSIISNPSKLKDKAIDQIHTTEFWLELATSAHIRFTKHGNRLPKSSRLISKELFNGFDYIYACYCLHQYLALQDDIDRKFRSVVMVLFF